ncbi:protein argonaute 4-like isoform X3 [Castanea sativa]|uniref:protein argonaute 4-like isoform X3 n=1 Tax=Castanea sativa TaxID=21020 RepID=UPI003F64E181
MEKSRQKPQERMKVLSEALKCNKHDSEPLLHSCGILISTSFTQEYGRVLPAPRLKVGNGEDFFPRNGRWNFNNKKLVQPTKIESWAVVIFSARSDTQSLVQDLLKCGDLKGIQIDAPFDVFQENPHNRCALLMARVEKMFQATGGGYCFWGKIPLESLYMSWESSPNFSLGQRAEIMTTVNMNSCFSKFSCLNEDKCISVQLPCNPETVVISALSVYLFTGDK